MTIPTFYDDSEQMAPRVKLIFSIGAGLVAIFIISVFVRSVGSYYGPVDGWGTSLFELSASIMCMRRYREQSWRSNLDPGRLFPLILGIASAFWSTGDIILAFENAVGITPSVPSVVDAFYVCFFPLCCVAIITLLKREGSQTQGTAWLDRIIAALGVATIFAAFVVHPVLKAVGGVTLSSATSMAYPTMDLILLAVAAGGLVTVAKDRRRVLSLIAFAVTINAIGDTYNLLQPNSRIGYVANAAAWPVSLLILSFAAWTQPHRDSLLPKPKSGGFVLPGIGAAAGMIILLFASFAHVGSGAIALATATLFVTGYRMTLTVRRTQAENDLRQKATDDRQRDLLELLTEVASNAELLSGASDRLTTTARQLSSGAEEASSQADVVASVSDLISSSTQSVASGTEEMASSIAEITRSAAEALSVGIEAKRESEETSETIGRLADSSAKIGQVIAVITSIAQQTNLLALNATIEAARAGTSGKGFAVVASEVKDLATETAKATDEISAIIRAIQNDTESSVDAIGRISETIGKINDIQTTISVSVEHQNVTTSQVSRSVGEVSQGSGQISHHIAVAAQAAKGTAEGSNDALSAASELATMASTLKTLVAQHGDLIPS